jgi:hypothetical protein
VQEKIESSPEGRAVISVFVVLTIVCLVLWNLPDSGLRKKTFSFFWPYVNTLGVEQNWGVFAPDPRRQTIDPYARVTMSDGSQTTYRMPSGDPVVGGYWDYRWRKWTEYVTQGSRTIQLAQPAAIWLARHHVSHGRRPLLVQFVRLWYELRPPGHRIHGPPRWHEYAYYDLSITPEMLRGAKSQ